MPYYSAAPIWNEDCIRIKFNVRFIETAITEWYENYADFNFGSDDDEVDWLLKEYIPDEDWERYTQAIEDAYNNNIRNPFQGEDGIPNMSEWWLENHRDATPEVEDAYSNLFHGVRELAAATKITDWYAKIIAKRRIEAAKKISDWWLDCNYNPKYKYCRDKIWKQHQEICDE